MSDATDSVGERLYAELQRAMGLLWRSELGEATVALKGIALQQHERGSNAHEVCMEANVRIAQAAWLQAALSEVEKDAKIAFSLMKAAENGVPDKSQGSLHAASLQAELAIMKALLQLRTGSYLKGAYNLRKSWKLYESAMKRIGGASPRASEGSSPLSKDHIYETGETDSGGSGTEISDSSDGESAARLPSQRVKLSLSEELEREAIARLKFGTAAFHFFVSIIPQSLIFLVELIGFEADRDSGYRAIQAAFREQSSASPIAGILLLWIETFFMENFDTAQQISQECLRQYQGNVVMLYLSGYLERQQSHIPQALDYFSKASAHSKDIRQFRTACLYEQADCYWRLTDWEQAVVFFEKFNESNESKSYRCFGAYQQGVAHCFLGEEQRARVCFSKSTKWARKYFSFDAYAARKSSEFLRNTPCLSTEEKALVKSNCLRRQGKLLESTEILREICKGNADANIMACAFYQLGRALREMGEVKEAEQCFQDCIGLGKEVTREKYTIPHSLLEIGMIRLNGNDPEGATAALLAAKKHSSYDFDKPNLRRIMRCLDRAKSMSREL